MFSLKPVGNVFTLDWVVCREARAGSSRMAVMPMASAENRAIRKRSAKNFFHPSQRQNSQMKNRKKTKMQVNSPI